MIGCDPKFLLTAVISVSRKQVGNSSESYFSRSIEQPESISFQ